MAHFRIYPYKMGSQGASRLAEGLRERGHRVFKVYPDRNYRPRPHHIIVNWGAGMMNGVPNWYGSLGQINPRTGRSIEMLNHPGYVADASNKLTAFEVMQEAGVSVPEFLGPADLDDVFGWQNQGIPYMARTKLSGHSGDGCYYRTGTDTDDPYPEWVRNRESVKMYVKYIKKKEEYRVHVFRGQVIDIQQKRKRQEVANEEVNYQVRSHDNGWVFCRTDVRPAQSILDNSVAAVNSLGLDFGAVDVIWNQHQGQAYVLEVNTAPGLEGSTINAYVNALEELVQ